MSKHRTDPNYDTLAEREMDLGTGLDRLIDSERDTFLHELRRRSRQREEGSLDGRPSTQDSGDHDPLLTALIREHPEMAVKFWNRNE